MYIIYCLYMLTYINISIHIYVRTYHYYYDFINDLPGIQRVLSLVGLEPLSDVTLPTECVDPNTSRLYQGSRIKGTLSGDYCVARGTSHIQLFKSIQHTGVVMVNDRIQGQLYTDTPFPTKPEKGFFKVSVQSVQL